MPIYKILELITQYEILGNISGLDLIENNMEIPYTSKNRETDSAEIKVLTMKANYPSLISITAYGLKKCQE